MNVDVIKELAPTGRLRAGINMSNTLLVTGKTASGDPVGVAPDMARYVADHLGVPVQYVRFSNPGALADAAESNAWDIGLIGAEPQRAEKIEFSPPYVQIEATYLVQPGSTLHSVADVDAEGVSIVTMARAAYGLWLERNIQRATLLRAENNDQSFERFVAEKVDALAGLRSRLLSDAARVPDSRILDGYFMVVNQAIGTKRNNSVSAAFLRDVVEEAKRSGLVAELIARHKVQALSVAPAT
jgi:polar amino acid transport system substrate-binding protein